MRVTVGELHDAVHALTQIITRPRALSTIAKFKISKLHAALGPLYAAHVQNVLSELTKAHGQEQFSDEEKTQSTGWAIDENNPAMMEAFKKAWGEARLANVDLGPIQPLPLSLLTVDQAHVEKGVEANEFTFLGQFVEEGA